MQSPVVQTRKRTERQGKRINSTLLHKPRIKRGFLFCFCSISHMYAPQITGNDRAASSRRHMCSVPLRPHFITHMSYPSARLRPAFCPRTPRLCGRDFTERPPQIRYPRYSHKDRPSRRRYDAPPRAHIFRGIPRSAERLIYAEKCCIMGKNDGGHTVIG